MAPWWWFLCKPQHVGAASIILICFINSMYFTLWISWLIKWVRCWFVSSNSVFPVHLRENKKFKTKYSLVSKYATSMSCKTLPFKFYAHRNLVFCFSISIFQYRKTSIKHAVIHSSHSGVCIELHNRKHMLHQLHLTPQHQWEDDH